MAVNPADAPVSRSDFLAIMATFPTGVTIVTTLDRDGRPRGLASSAFSSVSADPPLILVCIDRSSRTLPALLERNAFCVNFLKRDRHELCSLFASKGDEKFHGVVWRPAGNEMPVLYEDSLAHAECSTENVVEGGDHLILVGRVVGGRPPADGEEPLAYYGRAYGGFSPNDVSR